MQLYALRGSTARSIPQSRLFVLAHTTVRSAHTFLLNATLAHTVNQAPIFLPLARLDIKQCLSPTTQLLSLPMSPLHASLVSPAGTAMILIVWSATLASLVTTTWEVLRHRYQIT